MKSTSNIGGKIGISSLASGREIVRFAPLPLIAPMKGPEKPAYNPQLLRTSVYSGGENAYESSNYGRVNLGFYRNTIKPHFYKPSMKNVYSLSSPGNYSSETSTSGYLRNTIEFKDYQTDKKRYAA